MSGRGCNVKPENLRAIELARAGLTIRQIASAQDRSFDAIRSVIGRATGRRDLPFVQERKKSLGYQLGADLLGTLPTEVLRWLITQRPEGGTINDAIRGIIVDAFHEANDSIAATIAQADGLPQKW